MEPDEVYDVLMSCFLATIEKFDPFYVDKVRTVIEVIDGSRLPGKFTTAEVNRFLDFDGARHVRLLARKKFLEMRKIPAAGPSLKGL